MTHKHILLSWLMAGFFLAAHAQTDTIFSNNDKISCTVKEIGEDAVRYCYPGEELLNSIYKNAVQKIVFKSGRVQVFAEATSFKTVNSVEDFENVTITQLESEVKGLFKLGDLSAKASGATNMSNEERVKERAYRKLKMIGAMMGGNIVYVTDKRSNGNVRGSGGFYNNNGAFVGGGVAQNTETSLTGIAYCNKLPDFETFKACIKTKRSFQVVEKTKLWSGAADYKKAPEALSFQITNIKNENGLIMLEANLEDEKKYTSFRVVSIQKDSFNIFYEDKSTSYNLKIQL